MKTFKHFLLPMLALGLILGATSCKKDDDEPMDPTPSNPSMMSVTYNYEFNNGQVVSAAAYDGMHSDALTASMQIDELSSTQTKITVTLTNTVSGATYHVHSHDAADPATTPNGTPYNETPNAAVFVKMATGNGGTISLSQTIDMSYNDLISNYNGFLVVHDPLQAMSTVDISTYLVVGAFARPQASSGLDSAEFDIAFNTGQVAAQYAYSGTHPGNITAKLNLQELADGMTRVSVMLYNTMNGEMYMIHSHDFADPATTPNNTPYNETPNSNVCTLMATGNGGTVHANQMSSLSISDLTTVYEGFFVVHDPLQPIDTTDPTTYLMLAQFARN